MPEIIQSEIAPNHIKIELVLSKDEIESSLEKALKKEQHRANLKGFRKGKAPLRTIKRLMGDQILNQSVYEQINTGISDFLKKEDSNFIGEPLPLDQEQKLISIDKIEDLNFAFELGILPEFELKGLGDDENYPHYDIEISDASAKERLESMQKYFGTQTTPEKVLSDNDILKVELLEKKDGKINPDGIFSDTSIHLKSLEDKKLKKALLKAELGQEFDVDIRKISPHKEDNDIRKHLLKIEEEKPFVDEFKMVIDEISHFKPAELDEEFYKKAFGEEVTTEEDALDKAKSAVKDEFQKRANELLYQKVYDQIMELNMSMDLPDEYLKNWISSSDKFQGGEEEMDKQLKAIRQSIIREKLVAKLEVKIEEKDIVNSAYRQVYSYGIREEQQARQMVDYMLQNKEIVNQMRSDVEIGQIIEKIPAAVSTKNKKLKEEAFNKIYEEAVKAVNEKQKDDKSVNEEE